MNWYLVLLAQKGRTIDRGWMLASDDNELVSYARVMGYSIAIEYLGKAADGEPARVEPGTESDAYLDDLKGRFERA